MMVAPLIRKPRMIAEVATALPSGAVVEAWKYPAVPGAAEAAVSGRAHQPTTTARINRPKIADATRMFTSSPFAGHGTPLCQGLTLYERSCSHT
ncbi:hypothetical protein OG203_18910 [Nocardia sp. NBC_01499]|uniref:hypothetical protein n=1 Tax=Nocardia sp. NBC_01499 TaxID=2903597 RepID=UPI0038694BC4